MSQCFDVFNGDADGICALLQLRKAEPRPSKLVTGVKRDISLLQNVDAKAGDKVVVLDISMEKNATDLQRLLDAGAEVLYVDHHFPGTIPQHPHLKATINENADTCTSVLVNGLLKGAYKEWAITGAFGDNLKKTARGLAAQTDLSDTQIDQLEALGTYINYNGYGPSLDDLHFTPAALFETLNQADGPFDFIDNNPDFIKLETGYREDMAKAASLEPLHANTSTAVFMLPDEAWARRVSGVYSNDLTVNNPDRAHAVITAKADGDYLVSVRAPLSNKTGAVDLCRQFPTGGGRAAAAGINSLPASQLQEFIDKFSHFYGH